MDITLSRSTLPLYDNSSRIGNHEEFLIVRIDALLIFVENGFVALCLYKERRKFVKREFWLQLISLIINDLFVSVSLFLWSFIYHDIFDKSFVGCAVLTVCVTVSQMALLLNVLSICIYRLMFLVCTDRYRFGWKGKTTVKQVFLIYIFSFFYMILPIFIWGNYEKRMEYCSPENLFGTGQHTAFIFIGTGLLAPLTVLNVLYGVTFHLLRRQLGKRNSFVHVCRNSLLLNRSSSSQRCHCRADVSKSKNDKVCNRTDAKRSRTLSEERTGGLNDNTPERTNGQNDRRSNRADDSCSKPYNRGYNSVQPDKTTFKQNGFTSKEKHSIKDSPTLKDVIVKEKQSTHHDTEPYCSTQSVSNRPTGEEMASNISDRLIQRHEMLSPCQENDVHLLARCQGVNVRNSARELQKQSLVLIGLILILIDVTVIPFIVYLITEKLLEPILIPEIVREILCLLVMNNSLLNPWLYAIQSKEVRRAIFQNLKQLFHCIYSCKIRDKALRNS